MGLKKSKSTYPTRAAWFALYCYSGVSASSVQWGLCWRLTHSTQNHVGSAYPLPGLVILAFFPFMEQLFTSHFLKSNLFCFQHLPSHESTCHTLSITSVNL